MGNCALPFTTLPNYLPKLLHRHVPHQQCMRVPISPHLHQPLVSPAFLKSVPNLLESGEWHFILALICLPLKNDDVERLFIYLLAICVSYLVKYLLGPFVHL